METTYCPCQSTSRHLPIFSLNGFTVCCWPPKGVCTMQCKTMIQQLVLLPTFNHARLLLLKEFNECNNNSPTPRFPRIFSASPHRSNNSWNHSHVKIMGLMTTGTPTKIQGNLLHTVNHTLSTQLIDEITVAVVVARGSIQVMLRSHTLGTNLCLSNRCCISFFFFWISKLHKEDGT